MCLFHVSHLVEPFRGVGSTLVNLDSYRMDDRNDGHVSLIYYLSMNTRVRGQTSSISWRDIDMYLYLICWLHFPRFSYSSKGIHLWLSFSSRSLIHFSFDASSSYSFSAQLLMDAFLRIRWSGIHHQSCGILPSSGLFDPTIIGKNPCRLLTIHSIMRTLPFDGLRGAWLLLSKSPVNPLYIPLLR